MRIVGYAYPWDVTTPGFIQRAQDLGVDEIAIATAYHSTRAATPWSETGTAVHAPSAALYRPVRRDADWAGLVPLEASWIGGADPVADAVRICSEAGLPALAWTVLTHSSRLGAENPQLTVRNCFGERYPWALCPSRPEVRRYAATLAEQAVTGLGFAGILLEACGQLGAVHQCQHEKTDAVWSPAAAQVLSICCCSACAAAWDRPADAVRRDLREQARRLLADEIGRIRTGLDPELAAMLLTTRQAATDTLRRCVIDGVARSSDAAKRTVLHAAVDPWVTGALPGITPATPADVDVVVLPCWAPGDATLAAAGAAREQLPRDVAVGAYVTAVGATARTSIADDVRALAAAGVDELHLYHLGLAGPARWPLMKAAADTAKGIR